MAKNKAAAIMDKISNAISGGSGADGSAEQSKVASQATTPAVEPEDAGQGAAASAQRTRGPVEEVIAKRAKQLSKKIQRFQSYASLPPTSLNADQKAAVASLPVLTAQSRELEDLIKPGGAVEVVELNEAAKLRSAKEEADRLAKGDVEAQISSNIESISQNISLFLRLHALLHPARPADHTQLTFSPLDLPAHLQDEVQATDVLRVGRMYDELLGGGKEAEGVVRGLSIGADGEDEENDHIHHLLHLLSHPPSHSVSIPATRPDSALDSAPQQTQAQDAERGVDEREAEAQIATAPASESGHGQVQEPSEIIHPASQGISGAATPAGTNAGAPPVGFNFLQADELNGASAPAATAADESGEVELSGQGQKKEGQKKEGLEEYEVVPALQAHETAEYDPSGESQIPEATNATPAADATSTATAQEPAETVHPLSRSGLLVDDSAPVNWADDEDENEPISLGQSTTSAPSGTPAVVSSDGAVPALGAPVAVEGAAAAPSDAPTGPRARGQGQAQGRGRGRGQGQGQGGARSTGFGSGRRTPQGANANGDAASGTQQQQQRPRAPKQQKSQQQQQPAAIPVPGKQGVVVDADGFESKIRTGKNASMGQGQGAGQQGRPSQGQGRTGSGLAGRGRGRGGPPRGDTRTPPVTGGQQQNGVPRAPRPQQNRQNSNKPAAAQAQAPASTPAA